MDEEVDMQVQPINPFFVAEIIDCNLTAVDDEAFKKIYQL